MKDGLPSEGDLLDLVLEDEVCGQLDEDIERMTTETGSNVLDEYLQDLAFHMRICGTALTPALVEGSAAAIAKRANSQIKERIESDTLFAALKHHRMLFRVDPEFENVYSFVGPLTAELLLARYIAAIFRNQIATNRLPIPPFLYVDLTCSNRHCPKYRNFFSRYFGDSKLVLRKLVAEPQSDHLQALATAVRYLDNAEDEHVFIHGLLPNRTDGSHRIGLFAFAIRALSRCRYKQGIQIEELTEALHGISITKIEDVRSYERTLLPALRELKNAREESNLEHFVQYSLGLIRQDGDPRGARLPFFGYWRPTFLVIWLTQGDNLLEEALFRTAQAVRNRRGGSDEFLDWMDAKKDSFSNPDLHRLFDRSDRDRFTLDSIQDDAD